MTSNELKHQAKVQKWGLAIQDCRSSGLSVREWCRQRGITPTTYYRWEREVLSGIGRKDAEGRSGGTFVELPAPQPLRNNSESAYDYETFIEKDSIQITAEEFANEMFCPIVKSAEDLVNEIRQIESYDYQKLEVFRKDVFADCDGNSVRRVAEYLQQQR